MKDYSIEYAHIYTNQEIDLEHEFSTEILNNVFKELNGEKSLVVMVDDYSFPDPTFDYVKLNSYLEQKNFSPDVVLRESQLIPFCDIVLSKVNDQKKKSQLINYIKSNKYPCSLFIATWYLIRLGKIESSMFDPIFSAKKIINILPESFQPFEEKAFEIIKSTKFSHCLENIENRYFEGRIIA